MAVSSSDVLLSHLLNQLELSSSQLTFAKDAFVENDVPERPTGLSGPNRTGKTYALAAGCLCRAALHLHGVLESNADCDHGDGGVKATPKSPILFVARDVPNLRSAGQIFGTLVQKLAASKQPRAPSKRRSTSTYKKQAPPQIPNINIALLEWDTDYDPSEEQIAALPAQAEDFTTTQCLDRAVRKWAKDPKCAEYAQAKRFLCLRESAKDMKHSAEQRRAYRLAQTVLRPSLVRQSLASTVDIIITSVGGLQSKAMSLVSAGLVILDDAHRIPGIAPVRYYLSFDIPNALIFATRPKGFKVVDDDKPAPAQKSNDAAKRSKALGKSKTRVTKSASPPAKRARLSGTRRSLIVTFKKGRALRQATGSPPTPKEYSWLDRLMDGTGDYEEPVIYEFQDRIKIAT